MIEKKISRIDLNCDMGESDDKTLNHDGDIMPYISSCNISCGYHSGNPSIIERTISLAVHHNVSIGAHPSYNDRANYGRKVMDTPMDILRAELRYQISAIKSMTESLGGQLHHVKAHGALYNEMSQNRILAENYIEIIQSIDPDMIVYAMADSIVIDICNDRGVAHSQEVFVDRNYIDGRTLVSRSEENALIHHTHDIINRVDDILSQNITDINNQTHTITPETICLHSDTPNAITLAKSIHHHLINSGIEISSH